MSPVDNFEIILIFGKVALIIGLLILSFINVHTGYISDKPREFIADCVVSGASGALAFMMISLLRGKPNITISLGITTFLFLFTLNFFFEFSGFNSDSTDPSKMTSTEAKEEKILKWPVLIMGVLGVLALVYFAYKANVPMTSSFLPIEVLLFGLASGASAAFVAKNHGATQNSVVATGVGSGVLFGLVHIALQKGGFYNNNVFV